ncbi:hypothetical protein [Coxiella-like endosymbiont]|uniref:hypothetical protein n=1 Tax=Coxiella-like endosymbiont TaxID=1592897 RepID=UPI00272C8CF2|nr:hypothetical protein [Coxiella-like endosymbiont]
MYCGVGADEVFGHSLVGEEYAHAFLDAGIMLFGTNAEVMPGQWDGNSKLVIVVLMINP